MAQGFGGSTVCARAPTCTRIGGLSLLTPLSSMRAAFVPQAHQQAWLYGALSAVDPEAVECGLAAAAKALSKLGKVRAQLQGCKPPGFCACRALSPLLILAAGVNSNRRSRRAGSSTWPQTALSSEGRWTLSRRSPRWRRR